MRIALILALFATPCFAKTVSGDATFSAKAVPGFLTIDGKGGHVDGVVDQKDGKVTGEFKVALKDFDTGLGLRNEHMKDKYLEVDKFPEAKLVLKPWLPAKEGATFEGDLTLKGQTKPVHGVAKVDGGKLSAGFAIKLSDYPAIGVPTFKGVGVQDEVLVSVEANVN